MWRNFDQTSLASFVLVAAMLMDPLLAAWPEQTQGVDQLVDALASELRQAGPATALLDPVLTQDLGSEVANLPAVWGSSTGRTRPAGLPAGRLLTWPPIDVPIAGIPPTEQVVWSLRNRLDGAIAQVVRGTRSQTCQPFDGLRANCQARSWHFVGRHAGAIKGVEVPCVWAHPVSSDRLIVRLGDLPQTDQITGFVGLIDGSGKGARVEVEVRFGGRKLSRVHIESDKAPVHLSARPFKAAPGDLEIRIRADNDRWRLLCLDLYGLTTPAEPGS